MVNEYHLSKNKNKYDVYTCIMFASLKSYLTIITHFSKHFNTDEKKKTIPENEINVSHPLTNKNLIISFVVFMSSGIRHRYWYATRIAQNNCKTLGRLFLFHSLLMAENIPESLVTYIKHHECRFENTN